MRAAPAVSVHCTGGAVWRAIQWVLPALAAGVFGLWGLQHQGAGRAYAALTAALMAALMAFVAGAIAWRLTPQQSTTLNWDGQQWWVESGAGALAGDVQVMIDLGPWLLLRFVWPHGRRWLAVTQRDMPAGLHALRIALYGLRSTRSATAALAETRDV
jgi:hypothetical protein